MVVVPISSVSDWPIEAADVGEMGSSVTRLSVLDGETDEPPAACLPLDVLGVRMTTFVVPFMEVNILRLFQTVCTHLAYKYVCTINVAMYKPARIQ